MTLKGDSVSAMKSEVAMQQYTDGEARVMHSCERLAAAELALYEPEGLRLPTSFVVPGGR